jgi:geranylgeranyl pyrophosphate synthase
LGFTMQKLFNVMSVAAFTMSAGMVAGTAMLYSRIPSMTKHYMSELRLELTKMVTDMVPGQIDEVMPELPTSTGPALPIKSPF